MIALFMMMGSTGWVLVLLAAVVAVSAVRVTLRLRRRDRVGQPTFEHGLNGIIFWGALSAVVGLLGQFFGLWYALDAISRAEVISPRAVARGVMESFSTTIFGLVILALSALAWFALRSWTRRLQSAGAR
jgi:biopolymer transport protein ExbB/TolQ